MMIKYVLIVLIISVLTCVALSFQVGDREMAAFILVNEQREKGFVCPGGKEFPPIETKLKFSCKLWRAAKTHTIDMLEQSYFSHQGLDGSTPWTRAERQGTTANSENIARGTGMPAIVLEQWLRSMGHCHNLMDPEASLLGVAYEKNPGSKYKEMWTMMVKRGAMKTDSTCLKSRRFLSGNETGDLQLESFSQDSTLVNLENISSEIDMAWSKN